MSSTRELLFSLTRQRFTPAHRARAEQLCRDAKVDWKALVQMAANEGVAPIAGVNFVKFLDDQDKLYRDLLKK